MKVSTCTCHHECRYVSTCVYKSTKYLTQLSIQPPPPNHLKMCQYRAITYSCGHTVHSRVRSSQECGTIPCSSSTTVQTTTYHWCSPCNRGEGFRRTNLRPRRSAQIVPSDIAAAVARENARTRRARNISVPEPVIPLFVGRAVRAPFSDARREIPGVGKQLVGATRSFLGDCGRIIVLFCALFCSFLVYTGWFFVYWLEQLVLTHLGKYM